VHSPPACATCKSAPGGLEASEVANFVALVDPDRDRRERFLEKIEPLLPLMDGLVTGRCEGNHFAALWAASPHAPVSHVADAAGAALVWGDAIPGPGPKRLDAASLRKIWGEGKGAVPAAFDGLHVALVHGHGGRMTVGADLLGIMPVYYCSRGDVLLAASSPELLRHHPACDTSFNPAGLAGILLMMHLVGRQTLWRGVRRLGAGNALRWNPGADPVEVVQYRVPATTRYFDLSFSSHVEVLDRALDSAVARHVTPETRPALLLSGGLDSRMLGGYMKRHAVEGRALTFGVPSDLEMQCAVAVARALGFEHRAAEIPFDDYPRYAGLEATWNHGAQGLGIIMGWGMCQHVRALSTRVVTGYLTDCVVGGAHVPETASRSGAISFDSVFGYHNRYGFTAPVLKSLLRRGVFRDVVDETIGSLREEYEGYSQFDSQRDWCFNLYHRQRFFIGGQAWRLSFGAWPAFPAADREVLDAAGGMPLATLGERRAEKELVREKFPALAELPLDRNGFNTEPLQPRLRYRIRQHLLKQIAPVGRVAHLRRKRVERRYYYRVFDINGPGWSAVRREAEPYRSRLSDLLDKSTLDALLPPPDVPLHCDDPIIDSAGPKTLLGLFLWAKDHL
jgi:asparagine synthase (glutamine-hydrolysing)